jgi:hypothetical protein
MFFLSTSLRHHTFFRSEEEQRTAKARRSKEKIRFGLLFFFAPSRLRGDKSGRTAPKNSASYLQKIIDGNF